MKDDERLPVPDKNPDLEPTTEEVVNEVKVFITGIATAGTANT